MRSSVPERTRPAKLGVYRHLRELILRDAIDGPHFLTEEMVALELGVSRTPVREAFLMLEAEGLLQLTPRKGALVVPITSREVREVTQVRSVVETWCAQQVLRSDERRAALVLAMQELHEELAGLGSDPTALIDTDRRFHRELVAAADNRVMLDLYERLRDRQLRMGVRAVLGDPLRVAAVRAEHQAILDALAEGDEEALVAAIRAHLERTRQSVDRRMADA
jgi:DNA-binding GntR family transcriptional regulator